MPDDPAVQTFLLQKSQLMDFVSKVACKDCGSDLECTKTKFEYTAGQFQFRCGNKKCCKQIDFDTQILCGSHYTINQALIAANHVNQGSLTSLNNTMNMIRASTIAESYYAEITGVCNLTILQQQLEETTAALQRFKEQNQRNCEADATFSTQGGSPCGTFGVINQENNEVIHVDPQYVRDTPDKNAWKLEGYCNEQWFEVLKRELIELDDWVHDACAKLSKTVVPHIAHFKELHDQDNQDKHDITGQPLSEMPPFKPRTRDCNDTWHGKRSYEKLWSAFIILYSKAVKRGNSKRGIKKESKDIIRNKQIASRQLRSIDKRVKDAFMQVTGSVHAESKTKEMTEEEKEKRVMNLLAEVLMECLIFNNHKLCKECAGESTECVLEAAFEAELDADRYTECQKTMRNLPHQAAALGDECNLYTLDQALESELMDLEQEVEATVREEAEEADDDADAIDEILEGSTTFSEDIEDTTENTDPNWPRKNVLTHPIAIKCLMAFLNSKKLRTLMTKHVNCRSTSMIESFNAVIHKYAPKRFHFDKSYKARVGMATLDWNETQRNRTVREAKSGRRYVQHRDKTYYWQQEMLSRMGNYLRW